MSDKITPRDFCIFILGYGRADVAKKLTWKILDKQESKARRFMVCSTDDKTLDDYYKTFGKENVLVFDKDEVEKRLKMDLIDCFHNYDNIKKGTVWARNACFKLARDQGYRYFMVFDDDIEEFTVKSDITLGVSKKKILSNRVRILPGEDFDNLCEVYFRILDSAPWLNSVAYSQGGDYIGGIGSRIWKKKFIFKAMNIFFCDTEKEHRYYGRMNDDVNAYALNGSRGKISFTPAGVTLNQLETQKCAGGMTEMYRSFGTWMKSIYSVVLCPGFIKINRMGNKHDTSRIHHTVLWTIAIPRVIPSKYSKSGGYKDYKKEVMQDEVVLDDAGNLQISHNVSPFDKLCEVPSESSVLLTNNLLDLF